MLETLGPIVVIILGVSFVEPKYIGLEFPWSILVVFVSGYIPAVMLNIYVPSKCPNERCGKISLYKETYFPSITSNGYFCKNCKKSFSYKFGKLN